MRFADQVVIVTGSGQGIGRAIARRFAAEGARAVVADRNQPQAESVVAEIQSDGGQALAVHVDVSQADQVEAMVAAVVQAFGRIDVLVNNAGMTYMSGVVPGRFDQLDPREWDRILGTNLGGVFLVSRAVAPHLIAGGGGAIINLASVHSYAVNLNTPHYDAAKAAVVNLTRNMAVAMGPHNIRVNAIAPGAILTEIAAQYFSREQQEQLVGMSPMNRMGSPEEIASVAAFLASPEASFVTGVTLPVDGGFLADHWRIR